MFNKKYIHIEMRMKYNIKIVYNPIIFTICYQKTF